MPQSSQYKILESILTYFQNETIILTPCSGELVLRVLDNVKQTTIRPIIEKYVKDGTLIYTGEYNFYNRLTEWGFLIKRSVIQKENMLEMMMEMGFSKSMLTLKKVFGQSYDNVQNASAAIAPTAFALSVQALL